MTLSFSFAYSQKKASKSDRANLTPEQRMVQSNSKKKKGGRDNDLSKKVARAKKQDRSARKTKAPKSRKPKRKN
jgi:hypothetical protein